MSITASHVARHPAAPPRHSVRTAIVRAQLPLIAAGSTAIIAVGAGTPSYWGDEAASVMSASRSLPSLLGELSHIDAVHGLYYLFLHFWIGLVGTSEFAVRLPSAVAAGVAVAGTVALARRLTGPRTALVAGGVMLVIPQLTRMGIEARSYAFGIAAAVWLTVLLVTLLQQHDARRLTWMLYAVALAASIYLFLYLALLVLVHATAVMALRSDRPTWRRWLRSVTGAAVLSLPIVLVGASQRHQIAFLAQRDYATWRAVAVSQWFGTPAFALVAWALVAIGVASVVVGRRRTGRWSTGGVIAIALTVLPTGLLLAGNAWISPMYNMRYTAFSLPGVAILIAIGVTAIVRRVSSARIQRAVTAGLLLVLIAASVPTFLAQRQPFAKDGGSDLRQTAETIGALARPGDAVVFDQSVKPSRRPRLAIDLYPSSFAGVSDIALRRPYSRRSTLWDSVTPFADLGPALAGRSTVWAVELAHSTSSDVATLTRQGFDVVDVTTIHRTVIYQLVKEQP